MLLTSESSSTCKRRSGRTLQYPFTKWCHVPVNQDRNDRLSEIVDVTIETLALPEMLDHLENLVKMDFLALLDFLEALATLAIILL